MIRLLTIVALALIAWRMFVGRWPWQPDPRAIERRARSRARDVLGVGVGASRQDIIEAHRRLIAIVHPDRGGRNEDVHEANAARDILLGETARNPQEHA